MHARTTKLVERREPTGDERNRGAEIVFVRAPRARGAAVRYTILASRCHEGWEQWGAPPVVLADNGPDVEAWRRKVGAE